MAGDRLKLHEYQAKGIFRKYGIEVPYGIFVDGKQIEDALQGIGFPCVIKAQVLVGGRGKAGAIKIVNSMEEAVRAVEDIGDHVRGAPVRGFLVEKMVPHDREFYMAITVDREMRMPVLMASREGGVDIESVSEDLILRRHIDPIIGLRSHVMGEVDRFMGKGYGRIASALYSIFRDLDAELVEINPLAATEPPIALDAKIILDSDALFRHPELGKEEEEKTPLEIKAAEKGIAFIQLDGDIGVIANGAGLTMATLDSLMRFGGRGGVFLDLGGTDDPEKVKSALMLMKDASPSVILVNIFGGITKCDTVAKGIVAVVKEVGIEIPIVARIKGRNQEEGRRILKEAGIESCDTMAEAVMKAIELEVR